MTSTPAQSAAAAAGLTELELVEDHGPVAQYRAMSAEQGRRVSVWHATTAAFPDARSEQRFVEAAKESMRLGSAYVSPPLSLTAAAGGGHWLVADLPRGMTLDDVLALRGKLDPEDVVQLAQVLCDALTEVHDAGLVHHGLRPQAVQVMGDVSASTVRLGDFALGFLPVRGATRGPNGVPLVAAAYAAPECIQGHEPSPASDLYALGCLLYTAVTGRPPFSSNDAGEVLEAQLSATVPPLPEGLMHLHGAIAACLEKDPQRRPTTARELAGMLGKANKTMVSAGAASRPGPISYPRLPQLPQAQPGSEAPGDSLGQYKLIRLLGEGAMGRVFLAQHMLLGRQVALKILRPEQYKKEDLIQRFFQEARTVNQINHEHIVEIIDFVLEPGPDKQPRSVYCVMEVLEGKTLHDALAAGPIDLKRTARVLGQVCSALSAAHRVGVVHRDVKPENIFLTVRDGEADYVKVLDFGVAKLTAAQTNAPLVSTMDGALVGTPMYMSPEQAAGQPVDHRSDIYAVGVILYELLTGKVPFSAANFGALAVQIITGTVPPLPERTQSNEPLPAGLKRLVLRCLEKKVEARPQSMEEVREALAALGKGEALPAEADALAVRRGPGTAVWGGLAAAVLLLGGGAAWWATRPPPEVPGPVVKVEPPPVKVEPPPTVVKRDPKDPVVASVTKAPPIEARPREGIPEDDDGPAVYETWWFWTLVVGAVGGGAAAIALTQDGGGGGPAGFRTTVSW